MSKIIREAATHEEDLPHKFTGTLASCLVCRTVAGDPRHDAWERQQLADREQASAVFQRETGS